jgi:hypothetical protein
MAASTDAGSVSVEALVRVVSFSLRFAIMITVLPVTARTCTCTCGAGLMHELTYEQSGWKHAAAPESEVEGSSLTRAQEVASARCQGPSCSPRARPARAPGPAVRVRA